MSGGFGGSSSRASNGTGMLLAVGLLLSLDKVRAEVFEGGNSWALPRHSFTRTLMLDDSFNDWLLSASTVALGERVQLLPPVPDRFGMLWNKVAVGSHDFDVTFTFFAKPTGGSVHGGTFALWISPDNFTEMFQEAEIYKAETWGAAFETLDFESAYANKKKYRGCGIFFTAYPIAGVSCVCNDGKKPVRVSDIKPNSKSFTSKPLSWIWKPNGQVRVRITKDGTVTGHMMISPDPWQELFTLPPSSYKPEWESSYVGFTGWSGAENHLSVDIHKMEVRNFDETKVGEDDVATGLLDKRWETALGQGRKFSDQKSQTEAMQNLRQLLEEYNAGFVKEGQMVKSDLFGLVEKLDNLKQNVNKVIAESEAVIMGSGVMQVDKMRDHIQKIRTVITTDSQVHDQQIASVQKVAQKISYRNEDAGQVKSAAETVKNVEDQLASGSMQAHSLLFVFFVVLTLLGCLFFRRMRYYERKHYV